ncbi:MAG: acyltransferase family protein [Bacilli bacterium]|nr:acyltransferase family protein [Bacilli bacterium]
MLKKNNNVRQSNFEVMRIISMLFVVMWHLILHGGLYEVGGTVKFVLEFFVLFGVVHINSFVLVAGYFQYNKEFSLRKFLKIVILTWFYKVLFVLLFYFLGLADITKVELLKELLPIDFRDYWYINCYLLLYLLTPWLNKLIRCMSQKEYRKLLIVGFVVFSIIPLVTNQGTVANNGYTIVHFMYMYLIGAYLRKYPIDKNVHFINYSKNKKQILFLAISLFCLIFNFMTLQFSHSLVVMDNSLLREIGSYLFNNNRLYSNPVVIVQSIFYFLYFSTLEIKNSKINFVSRVVLDVYLIHENYYMIFYIYEVLQTKIWGQFGLYNLILLVIMWTLIIFIACILLGLIRDFIFDFVGRRRLFVKTQDKFYNYLERF